jgi:hypothetical protein
LELLSSHFELVSSTLLDLVDFSRLKTSLSVKSINLCSEVSLNLLIELDISRLLEILEQFNLLLSEFL